MKIFIKYFFGVDNNWIAECACIKGSSFLYSESCAGKAMILVCWNSRNFDTYLMFLYPNNSVLYEIEIEKPIT